MTINYLPGQPNNGPCSCSFVNWNTIQILAYMSGNNLVILTKNSTHLQTIYLPEDSFVVDINRVNGKIAIAINNQVYVYTPEIANFYNFNFHGRKNINELKIEWVLEHIITNENDSSSINTLSWSDYTETSDQDLDSHFLDLPPEFNSKTSCELITGSDKSLTMHQMLYKNENGERKLYCSLLWYKEQPNPIYKVKFSPNATSVASIGYYDKNVKLWHRTGFTSEFCDFELHYLLHDTYVTDIIWKNYMTSSDPNNNNDSKSNSGQIKPSNSFILKPANSIFRNDLTLLSETSSLYSINSHKSQHNVLYTFTANSILRAYSTFRLDKGFTVFHSGSLDLFEDDPSKRNKGVVKSVAILDNPYLELGLEKMLADLEVQNESILLNKSLAQQNKLLGFIKSKIELCMVIGSDGEINLYGLENLWNQFPTKMNVFKINKLKADDKLYLANIGLAEHCLPRMSQNFILKSFQINHYSSDLALTLVIHDCFKNTIREIGFTFDKLFQFDRSKLLKEDDSSYKIKSTTIGYLQQKFTGHNKSVRRLIRSNDGSSILSLTRFNENYLWTPIYLNKKGTTLTKKSIIVTPSPVLSALIWKSGEYVLAIVKNKLISYHCFNSDENNRKATEVCSMDIEIDKEPDSFFLLPESSDNECHVVLVFKDGSCKSFEFTINETQAKKKYEFSHCEIDNLNLNEPGDSIRLISPINPVGWKESIDRIGRAVLSTISQNGEVSIYYTTYSVDNGKHEIRWHLKDRFRTGIKNCAFVSCSSINKMAIIDRTKTKLSIWDMSIGVCGYSEEFPNEIIKDLDWTSTEFEQGILAVGFKLHSLLFTELRYDYTNRTSSFAKIKKVEISEETTHEIGDSIWMKDGILVIAAGNQLYLSDKSLDINNDIITNKAIGTLEITSNDLFYLCSALNGPLPLYHPQFIIQLLLTGRTPLIRKILVRLTKVLREIDLGERKENDFELGISAEEILADDTNKLTDTENEKYKAGLSSKVNYFEESLDNAADVFDEQCVDILIEKLQKMRLPFLTGHQQITLSHTVSIMKDVLLKYIKILDYNGLKFYLTMKLFTLNVTKDINTLNSIRMRDVLFALHSDNKDLLYDIVNEQSRMKIDWLNAKRYALPFWIENNTLKKVLEKVAGNEFLKFQDENDGKKDPTSCSIFYLMLRKKQVLLGLWKNSFGHPERDKMIKFLSNDFNEPRWKSAAMKNAYVLLGKHRYTDAASFFLLADSPKDAVSVIMRKLDDISLAIAVARCYEDSNSGPSMVTILERQLANESIKSNDRWKLSWIFWILNEKQLSAQALIKPLHFIKDDLAKILPNFKWPNVEDIVRTNNTEDPVLLVMYDSLRNRSVDYYKGISKLKPEHEFSFVIKAASMYIKMGCDWLALYLVERWKFSQHGNGEACHQELSNMNQAYEEEQTQRKRPGDILSKFMSSNSSSGMPKQSQPVNNLLGSFGGPPEVPNMLDAFGMQPNTPSILDSFSTTPSSPPKPKTANLLDNFVDPPTITAKKHRNLLESYTESQPPQPIKSKNLLNDFTGSTQEIAKPKKQPTPVPNMLDNWS